MQFSVLLRNFEERLQDPIPSTAISDIASVIIPIEYPEDSDSPRRYLSERFQDAFSDTDWERDTNLLLSEARKGTLHYRKKGIGLQISWRHYEKVGTELLKFQTDFDNGEIDLAVYVCITDSFQNYFKEHFKESITLEKLCDYLANVEGLVKVPLIILGLEPQENFAGTLE